jgi:hypothetical protein
LTLALPSVNEQMTMMVFHGHINLVVPHLVTLQVNMPTWVLIWDLLLPLLLMMIWTTRFRNTIINHSLCVATKHTFTWNPFVQRLLRLHALFAEIPLHLQSQQRQDLPPVETRAYLSAAELV